MGNVTIILRIISSQLFGIDLDIYGLIISLLELGLVFYGLRTISAELRSQREQSANRSFQNLLTVLEKLVDREFTMRSMEIYEHYRQNWPELERQVPFGEISFCMQRLNLVEEAIRADILNQEMLFQSFGIEITNLGTALRNLRIVVDQRIPYRVDYEGGFEKGFALLQRYEDWDSEHRRPTIPHS